MPEAMKRRLSSGLRSGLADSRWNVRRLALWHLESSAWLFCRERGNLWCEAPFGSIVAETAFTIYCDRG
jgi:hypothetical protein